MLDQVGEKLSTGVLHEIVEADTRPDKHLFYFGNFPELAQEHHVVGVVGIQIGAGLWGQTGPVPAHAALELLLAGGSAEGGGRPAHIVDVALEAGVLCELLHLPDHALMAAAGDGPTLVEGQRAEITRPEAPPVVGDREAHLLDGGYAPHVVVHGVGLPDIGQLGHPVQLSGGQREGGRVDNQEAVSMLLHDGLAGHRVVFLVLHHIGPGVGCFGGGHLLKGGNLHPGVGTQAGVFADDAGAPHVGDLSHRGPRGQPGGDLQGGIFPHAVGEDVRLGVEQDGPAHLVLPVVVVGKPAEGRLQPADDNGNVPKGLPHPVGVDHGGVVGTQAGLAAGGVGVVVAALLRGGVVGHHGVDVPRPDEHPQPGPAQSSEHLRAVPVRLGQHGHPIALRLQQPPDDSRAEGGVVHIGVPGDEQEVIPVPAPAGHVVQGHGEK